jgi:hypothetical protein
VNAEDNDEAVAIERFHLVPCQAAERLVGWHVPPFEASAALVDPGGGGRVGGHCSSPLGTPADAPPKTFAKISLDSIIYRI